MGELQPRHCIECAYDLIGLDEPRCPECGRAFDPANPETYGPQSLAAVRRAACWFTRGFVLAAWTIVILVVLYMHYPVGISIFLLAFYGGALALVATTALVAIRSSARLRLRRPLVFGLLLPLTLFTVMHMTWLPARIRFWISHGALEAVARDLTSGKTTSTPRFVGAFEVVYTQIHNDGAVQLSLAGPQDVTLLRVPDSQRYRRPYGNIYGERHLGGGWWMTIED